MPPFFIFLAYTYNIHHKRSFFMSIFSKENNLEVISALNEKLESLRDAVNVSDLGEHNVEVLQDELYEHFPERADSLFIETITTKLLRSFDLLKDDLQRNIDPTLSIEHFCRRNINIANEISNQDTYKNSPMKKAFFNLISKINNYFSPQSKDKTDASEIDNVILGINELYKNLLSQSKVNTSSLNPQR